MPNAPLTPAETQALNAAAQLLRVGRAQEAASGLTGLIAGGLRHPDVLLVYAAACERSGRLREALGACHAAAQAAPERADVWASLGRMLHEQGQSAGGAEALERAVQINPTNPEYWYNLGLASLSSGGEARAIEAFEKATELAPLWALPWAVLGRTQFDQGLLEEAERSLRRAVGLDSQSAYARHNLAVVLRRLDQPEEALSTIGALADMAPETRLVRAHVLADVGRYEEAVEEYRSVIAQAPHLLDAHETLAHLLPQLGAADQAFDSYRSALATAPTIELYRSAIATARSAKNYAGTLDWAKEAQARFGPLPDLLTNQALALGESGDSEGALAGLEALVANGFKPALAPAAYYRLKVGDLARAEKLALAATEANPMELATWACLTVIWRLLEDPRESWLADYENLVMPVTIEPPKGFKNTESFMAALAEDLTRLHTTQHHPVEQSLREGTQTRGLLFDRKIPTIQALRVQLQEQIEQRLSNLTPDPGHPFLGRLSGSVRFAGSWSVRLRSGGFHINHIHQTGWLSSALYVALPEGMADQPRGAPAPGALAFGIPDSALGIDLPPRRIETPQVGRLVIFPSYFWHGTLPFESAEPRLTVAFDALPA